MSRLFCNGMYKSGSTASYNICRKIASTYHHVPNPQKIHQLWKNVVKKEDILIYTFRDIRNSAASLMRKQNLNVSNFNSYHKQGLVNWLEFLVDYDSEVRMSNNKKLILQYETDIMNLEQGICKLFDFFNVSYNDSTVNAYIKEFNIDNTKAFVDSISKHDPKTQYHPNHIGDGNTKYTEYFDDSIYNKNTKIMDWLTQRNYI